jgi:hypothetical protein
MPDKTEWLTDPKVTRFREIQMIPIQPSLSVQDAKTQETLQKLTRNPCFICVYWADFFSIGPEIVLKFTLWKVLVSARRCHAPWGFPVRQVFLAIHRSSAKSGITG